MSAPRVVRARPRPKSRGRAGPAARARGLAPARARNRGAGGPRSAPGDVGAVPAPRPRSAPAGCSAWWDGVSHVVTRPICLDRLCAVGPPYFVNQVVQRNASGPTAHKWSKQKSASTIPPATPRSAPASPPAEQSSGPAGPRPRAARTIRASRASISLSRPMRACGDFSEPGAYGSSAAYSPSPGRLEFNARSSAVCMPPTTTASDDSRQPLPVPDVPGISPAVKSGGPESDRRPRGRAAMCAGTASTRPAGDPPCADTGLTVTLRHLLG